MRRTFKLAVCCLALAVPFTVAGCGPSDKASPMDKTAGTAGGSAAASPTQDAKGMLTTSVGELANGNFAFTGQDAETIINGELHKASQSASLKIRSAKPDEQDFTFEFRLIADSVVLKVDTNNQQLRDTLEIAAGKWYSLDKATFDKAMEGSMLNFDSAENIDPGDSVAAVKAVVSAQKGADGTFTGTTDLSGLTGGMIGTDRLTALGAKAKALPFTATLDSSGRLATFSIQVPASGTDAAYEYKMTYSNYGGVKAMERPSAVSPAPHPLIEWFVRMPTD